MDTVRTDTGRLDNVRLDNVRLDNVRTGLRLLLPLLAIALLLAPGYGAVLADVPDDGCVPALHARIVQLGAVQIVAPAPQLRLEEPALVGSSDPPDPGARPIATGTSAQWPRAPPSRTPLRVDTAA